ncbi:uncharacterized protein LOC117522622 [Thalassophryne amazonica]|uniref:uncharacterized protein LOC117522622 n=1 Tax=Thalassophryne amazonica TaxID=390379 RepID=UPI001471C68B|nr:uncharacterized protein LOC117522622 [Thalassophryne amazonica]
MKFLLLLFCVNLGSGIYRDGTGQQGGADDTVEEINNMLIAIHSTPFLGIYGDSMQGECPHGQQSKRTRIRAMGFDLDLWSAVMCTFAVMTTGPDHYARLYNPGKTVPGVSIQTFYLPLYAHNTASFMTVPCTLNPTFFVTGTLTGCDIFVATSGQNLNCPLVVIHTNACGTMTTDTNHQEAIAVLSIDICHQQPYQIQYRVASSEHRSIIERGGYHYTTEYYETSQSGIFFGYTLGSRYITTVPPWMFCRKNGLTTAIVCHSVA